MFTCNQKAGKHNDGRENKSPAHDKNPLIRTTLWTPFARTSVNFSHNRLGRRFLSAVQPEKSKGKAMLWKQTTGIYC
jgi:hypothetical protein